MIASDKEQYKSTDCSLAIIGGGPAGLSAAVKAWELGIKDIVIIEREHYLGGYCLNAYIVVSEQEFLMKN